MTSRGASGQGTREARLDHGEGLAGHLLADHLKHLILLQHLARHVEWQRVRVDNTLQSSGSSDQMPSKVADDLDPTLMKPR